MACRRCANVTNSQIVSLCPASLRVYRLLGIQKNVHYTDAAQSVEFDATRVNNIPQLERVDAPDTVSSRTFTPVRQRSPAAGTSASAAAPSAVTAHSYQLHSGGEVQATNQDRNELVGLDVKIYDNLWPGYEGTFTRTECTVVARCVRVFLHPDGQRCLTYLINYGDAIYPIKYAGLLDCLTSQQKRHLPPQETRC